LPRDPTVKHLRADPDELQSKNIVTKQLKKRKAGEEEDEEDWVIANLSGLTLDGKADPEVGKAEPCPVSGGGEAGTTSEDAATDISTTVPPDVVVLISPRLW